MVKWRAGKENKGAACQAGSGADSSGPRTELKAGPLGRMETTSRTGQGSGVGC